MAAGHTMTIEIPANLYERVQQVAQRSGVSEETAFLEGMSWFYGMMRSDSQVALNLLDTLPPVQLWAVVYQRPIPHDVDLLYELLEKGNSGTLQEDEYTKLKSLVSLVDYQMLLRSHALVLLKEQGYDVDSYFYSEVID